MAAVLPLFPPAAATAAYATDKLMIALVIICGGIAFSIGALLLYFAVRFGEKRHPKPVPIAGNNALELGWTGATLVVFLGMFFAGARVYYHDNRVPPHAVQIDVVAKQWMWKFEQPEGQREIDELHVPVNTAVALRLISQDVIHDFFVPDFRLKKDVLPDRYRTLWFRATKTGRFRFFCSQYCGAEHSRMRGFVDVLSRRDYARWLAQGGAMGSAAFRGGRLFQDLGCITCHRSASTARGPNLFGLYGRIVHLSDGTTVRADAAYLRQSILDPNAKIVAGYQPIMPTFRGQVTESQILDLIAYLRSLQTPEQRRPLGNRSLPPNGPRPTESHTQEVAPR